MELHISDTLGNRLLDLAHKDGYSGDDWAEKALAYLVEDQEDYRLICEAIAEGGENIPWAEAKKRLGLDDNV